MLETVRSFFGRVIASNDRSDGRARLTLEQLEDRFAPAVVYATINDWGSGLQGQITITNDQAAPIEDWLLDFDYDRSIADVWSAQLVEQSGSHYTFDGFDWNNTIGVGQSVSFGFIAGPSTTNAVPTNFVLTWGDDSPPPDPVTPTIDIADVSIVEGDPQAGVASGYLHTSGNQIVDANGQPVRIAGVNWFGLETTNFAPHGLWARNYQAMMDQMKEAGFNTIRLPFSDQLFDAASTPNSIDYAKNPDLQGLNGLQIMDKIVDYAGDIGLRILLDHHRSDAGNSANANGLWYTQAYPESQWIANWTMLASRYAGNSTVIGADLHNEPHGPATWGDGSANDWRLAAERAGNAILAVNSDWLIVVEGVEHGPSGNNWWGGNLSSAAAHPVRLDVANRLVYSPHDYPASVFPQAWFSDPNYPDNLPDVWDQHWGYLFDSGTAPILLGEFGSKLETTSDQLWAQKLLEYIQGDRDGDGTSDLGANQLGLSWTWWSWNPNSGDTGGILDDDWTTLIESKLDLLRPAQFDLDPGSDDATTQAVFTLTLSEPTTVPITLQYSTLDGLASQGSDYVASSGTVTFAPGEVQQTIVVSILRDTLAEATETFTLQLSSPVNAVLQRSHATATVLDDDDVPPPPPPSLPTLQIANASVTEGDTGTQTLSFTVTLSEASADVVSVSYATTDGSALAGSDYSATNGTLTFAPGETEKTIDVVVLGDTFEELDEVFTLQLSGETNVELETSQATGTILDDDFATPGIPYVLFDKRDDWGTGFVADMTIENPSSEPIGGWTLEFDLDADITNIWGATIVSRVGSHYVIASAPWNSLIGADGSVTFGFQGVPGLGDVQPTNITLNGVPV